MDRDPVAPVRIAVVARLTGVPEPTLRAWERRYGVPSPLRRPSGYRLYGQREIEQVREMRRIVDSGASASEAAALVGSRETPRPAEPAFASPPAERKGAWSAQVDAIVDETVRFDERACGREVRRALVLGSAVEIVREIFEPALRRVGVLWASDAIGIEAEHMVSQRISGALRHLIDLTTSERAEASVILASIADDQHDLGVLGVGVRLAAWGFRPIVLGARTPAIAIAAAVKKSRPDLVMIGITLPLAPKVARRELAAIGAACGDVPWIIGGAGAADVGALARAAGGRVAPDGDDALRELVLDTVGSGASKKRRRK